ncbi:MAG: hypothetical protein IPH28_06270 [Cytophagaceae bacterium]|nr:hypothetical protein [Cytophagaceae bacterium]MBK9935523.1 hypothetical protein [Cytophagaceae bacterium]MBL0324792.1 hypothetical protein [Cytophagaceae bacterium]
METSLRICEKGHRYFKSSDCPVCPQCDSEKKPDSGFLSKLVAPARRALENAGLNTLEKLSGYSEKEILNLHGIGKSSIPVLKLELEKAGLGFK